MYSYITNFICTQHDFTYQALSNLHKPINLIKENSLM